LFAQAAVLAALGLWAGATGLRGMSRDRVSLELMAVLAIATAAALALAARGLAAGRRWARSPAMVWELIMLPVGLSLVQAIPPAGAALLASAAVVLGGLLVAARGAPGRAGGG
jgi:hypothetical protein